MASVHRCDALFLNPQKIPSFPFQHTHLHPAPSNIPPMGHSLGTFRRWSDKQQNKGSERESERETPDRREEMLGFFCFFLPKARFTVLVFLFRFAEHLGGSKTSQTEGENHKSMISFPPRFIFHFPLFNYLFNSYAGEAPLSDFQLTDSSLNISSLKKTDSTYPCGDFISAPEL